MIISTNSEKNLTKLAALHNKNSHKTDIKRIYLEIPRWHLEGGSRKHAS
jgi:hypothetical protein